MTTTGKEDVGPAECLKQIRQANESLSHGQLVFNTDAQDMFEEACSDFEDLDHKQSVTKCYKLLHKAPITVQALARALLALLSMPDKKLAKEHLERMEKLHEHMEKDGTWDWEGAGIKIENLINSLKTKLQIT